MKRSSCWLGLLAVLFLSPAQALNLEIRALFRPDPSQPSKNLFVNQTPNSGYCVINPVECANNGMFSIEIPTRFHVGRAIVPGEGVGIQAPANWRRLTVTNAITGDSETVEVRIIGIGSTYRLYQSAASLVGVTDPLEGHEKLWSSSWVYAPSPCTYSGVAYYSPETYRFFWKVPVESACTKVAAYRIPAMAFDNLDFAYELRTPNPLGMSSGQYTGSLTYTLGPAGDFQMGSTMHPVDTTLTLDFVLDVQHTLKVELPPGGNKIVMEPAGGWQRWLESGKKPVEVFREQKFFLSASSPFKVMLVCHWSSGGPCSMGNGQGGATEFQVGLTVPGGIVGPGNTDGWSGTLMHNTWLGPFEPARYIDRRQGVLRFFIKDAMAIDQLLYTGGTHQGSVTIILDSEV
ncbi:MULTISPECIES: hypothetical protein [unclassified Pseudomonas]|uniref:hypothetical protein n=1 Tax=unclassified Pseudomonas TaxID=196821 RepID=UPI000A1E3205|nr:MULTISPECIES: hypothetical protein [unclassified Pseudomonas]